MKSSVLSDFTGTWVLLRAFACDLSVDTAASLNMLIESMAWHVGDVGLMDEDREKV